MKGKTAFQKITEAHLIKTLPDGSMVLRLDWVWAHEITTPNAIIDMKARGCDVVFDPNKIKAMIDHVNPAKDTASAIQGKIVRNWSEEHGVEFLDVGRNGVCHAIIPEKRWILPGQIGIMGDSHTCTHSAFCAFTAGVGTTEFENGIITGLWVCPPQKVIRVNFNGELPENVFAKDLILALIKKIGVEGATNAVIEFGGEVINIMTMEERMTITNMSVEAGATSGMMMFDHQTAYYLWPSSMHGAAASFEKWNSDPDAEYAQTIEIDVSDMVPVITDNYSPGDVVNVSELAGKSINQVYIGSCTNGRIEDLRIAASIFRQLGDKVADNVRCIVVPATQHIYKRALEEGLIATFAEAGCFISGPTCGACLGMSCGVLAPGEVCVSTTNRNFPGRMGKAGMVHLASPATAAITAIKGKITEPPREMCERALTDCFSPNIGETRAIWLTGWKDRPYDKPDYQKLLSVVAQKITDSSFSGKAFYLPANNIDTDQIIPAKYLTETEKNIFGQHCLEDAPIAVEDRPKLYRSQILVAGENFGCGSSREHAPWALEAAGIRCVIAPSFARIFENNMFNNGLLCITLRKETIAWLTEKRPETISVDLEKGEISWTEITIGDVVGEHTARSSVDFPITNYQKELIRNGGSVVVMLKLATELQVEGKI